MSVRIKRVSDLILEKLEKDKFTVYHRTKHEPITDFVKGFRVGGGAMYGAGLYSVQEVANQFNQGMINTYGPHIIEFEVTNTGNFIILDYEAHKRAIGGQKYNKGGKEKVSYDLISQLKKILKGDFNRIYNHSKMRLDSINKELYAKAYGERNANLAIEIAEMPGILQHVDGIIYSGYTDGNCVLIYNTDLATPKRYSLNASPENGVNGASDVKWEKFNALLNKQTVVVKDIYQSNQLEIKTNLGKVGETVKLETKKYTKGVLAKIVDELEDSDETITDLLISSEVAKRLELKKESEVEIQWRSKESKDKLENQLQHARDFLVGFNILDILTDNSEKGLKSYKKLLDLCNTDSLKIFTDSLLISSPRELEVKRSAIEKFILDIIEKRGFSIISDSIIKVIRLAKLPIIGDLIESLVKDGLSDANLLTLDLMTSDELLTKKELLEKSLLSKECFKRLVNAQSVLRIIEKIGCDRIKALDLMFDSLLSESVVDFDLIGDQFDNLKLSSKESNLLYDKISDFIEKMISKKSKSKNILTGSVLRMIDNFEQTISGFDRGLVIKKLIDFELSNLNQSDDTDGGLKPIAGLREIDQLPGLDDENDYTYKPSSWWNYYRFITGLKDSEISENKENITKLLELTAEVDDNLITIIDKLKLDKPKVISNVLESIIKKDKNQSVRASELSEESTYNLLKFLYNLGEDILIKCKPSVENLIKSKVLILADFSVDYLLRITKMLELEYLNKDIIEESTKIILKKLAEKGLDTDTLTEVDANILSSFINLKVPEDDPTRDELLEKLVGKKPNWIIDRNLFNEVYKLIMKIEYDRIDKSGKLNPPEIDKIFSTRNRDLVYNISKTKGNELYEHEILNVFNEFYKEKNIDKVIENWTSDIEPIFKFMKKEQERNKGYFIIPRIDSLNTPTMKFISNILNALIKFSKEIVNESIIKFGEFLILESNENFGLLSKIKINKQVDKKAFVIKVCNSLFFTKSLFLNLVFETPGELYDKVISASAANDVTNFLSEFRKEYQKQMLAIEDAEEKTNTEQKLQRRKEFAKALKSTDFYHVIVDLVEKGLLGLYDEYPKSDGGLTKEQTDYIERCLLFPKELTIQHLLSTSQSTKIKWNHFLNDLENDITNYITTGKIKSQKYPQALTVQELARLYSKEGQFIKSGLDSILQKIRRLISSPI